jgi:outer membrane protein TolC
MKRLSRSQRLRWAAMLVAVSAGCRSASVPAVNQSIATTCYPMNAVPVAMPEQLVLDEADVDDYVALALSRNPDIQSARRMAQAAWWRVPQAESLDDPMASVTAQPLPVQTAAGEQRVGLSMNQKLPWHGKLDARGARAAAEARRAEAEAVGVELEIVERTKRAYYELYLIDRSIDVTLEQQNILGDLINIAQARFRTGQVSQQDVLRLQVEVNQLDAELIRLRQQREVAKATLARVLSISPDSQLSTVAEIDANRPEAGLQELFDRAIAARPDLHAQLASIQASRQSRRMAELNYYPDVTLGVNYLFVDDQGLSAVANGQDAVILGATVNVPIYRKRLDAAVHEADARISADARRYQGLRDRTLEDVTSLWTEANSRYQLLELFRNDILPKSEQTFELSVRAYQVGEVDVLQLLDNLRELLRFQRTSYELEARTQQSIASLERIVGGPIAQASPAEESQVEEVPPPVVPAE